MRPQDGFPGKEILAVSIMGTVLVILGTRWGIGLTTDSMAYLQMADELRSGELVLSTSTWPPLYPAALALVGGGIQKYGAVRLLQVLLAGANVALFAALLFRLTRGNRFFIVAGSLLASLSLVTLETHTAAWSEPLFLSLLFAACFSLSLSFETQESGWAAISLITLSLVPLTRYVGAVFLLAGWLLVLAHKQFSWTRKLFFCLFSAIPLTALLIWNRINLGHSAGGSGLSPEWPSAEIKAGVSVVAAWIVPGIDRYRVLPHQQLLAVLLFLAWLGLLAASFRRFPEIGSSPLGRIVTLFALLYPAFLLTTIGLSRHDVPVDQRMLCPTHFLSILLTVAFLADWDKQYRRWARFAMVAWLLVYSLPAAYGTHFLYTRGRGYLGPNYQAPEIYRRLQSLAPTDIRTNDRDAARIWLGRNTKGMGAKVDGPLLFYRVEHPLPPNQEAGFKRDLVPDEYLEKLIRETPLKLDHREGKVELYLPVAD